MPRLPRLLPTRALLALSLLALASLTHTAPSQNTPARQPETPQQPPAAPAPQPLRFTLAQILSLPYSTDLTAAPTGNLFAWVEHTQGRNNLFVGSATAPARALTHNSQDDAQDILSLAWAPDASALAYTFGAETGADGRPANPAHLQHPTPVTVQIQSLTPDTPPVSLGEGRSPLFLTSQIVLFLRNGQIWSATLPSPANPAPPAPQQLVYDRGSASQLTLSPDRKLLAFISHRGSHSFLALFDLTSRTLTFPAASSQSDLSPSFSPDGARLAWIRTPVTEPAAYVPERSSPIPWSVQVMAVAPRLVTRSFTPTANQPGSALPHLSTGSPHVLWSTPGRLLFFSERDGWLHLYALDLDGIPAPPRLLTPGAFEVEDATLSPDGRTLLYASNQRYDNEHPGAPVRPTLQNGTEDRRHLWKLDLTAADALPTLVPGDLDDIETHPQFSADGHQIAALTSSPWWPMQPSLLAADGTLTPLHPAAPASASAPNFSILIAPPTPVTFPSKDLDPNQPIHAQLFLPPSDPAGHPHPAILFFHGGPRRQMLLGYPAMDYYSNAYALNQYLASRGFIVLSVNYRGGIGYGLNFREADNYGPNGASEYLDCLAAARYLRSRADIDPARIGVWGGSYGGFFTALALARNSDLFAAGVDFHGVHEWALEEDSPRYARLNPATAAQAAATLPGTNPGLSAGHDAAVTRAHTSSPLADIDRWRSPVLLIHGDNDPEVNYLQTPTLADALRARHVPVQELIFPDELHGFLLHRDWLAAYEATAAFFEQTLHPGR